MKIWSVVVFGCAVYAGWVVSESRLMHQDPRYSPELGEGFAFGVMAGFAVLYAVMFWGYASVSQKLREKEPIVASVSAALVGYPFWFVFTLTATNANTRCRAAKDHDSHMRAGWQTSPPRDLQPAGAGRGQWARGQRHGRARILADRFTLATASLTARNREPTAKNAERAKGR